jgi:hypothetical protein
VDPPHRVAAGDDAGGVGINLRPQRKTNAASPFDTLISLPEGTTLVSKNADHLRCYVPLPAVEATWLIRNQLLAASWLERHDDQATAVDMVRDGDEVLGSARVRHDGCELILVYRRG